MQYPELATVQARLTSFLVENLAAGSTVEWMDAFHAQRHAAEALGIADRELPWLGTRVDPRGYKSFGKRLSRKIVCGDCGRPFGHKTWHSGTPNRVDVWECPELRQARHLHHQPPLPGGAAGEDGRGVAGARWAQQHGG
ncbi:zinc ribbon domain-containing protein [Corynebacterium amycolatum]|uniref:zinc ribbon domain-containing protein n=1 Tax=Corynebacterium amycolatum TaxID=43765 RepID=UPI001F344D2E|nr:zinc ribbon domain-containing protein [Corynebacterium amycolatum]